MTDRELKKLSRGELLELLISEMERTGQLETEVQDLKAQLEDRNITISQSGTMAEAALKLNGVFEAAEAAGAQYLENLKRMSGEAEQTSKNMIDEAQKQCDEMLSEAREQCAAMRRAAMSESQQYWDDVQGKLDEYCRAHEGLSAFLDRLPKSGSTAP